MKFRGSYYGSGNQGWSDWKDVIHSGNISSYMNGYGFISQSGLNSQLSGYATLAGVQTFTNTNTFAQSPVIPNGTLGAHAVNLNQLNGKANALENATGIGFHQVIIHLQTVRNIPTSTLIMEERRLISHWQHKPICRTIFKYSGWYICDDSRFRI